MGKPDRRRTGRCWGQYESALTGAAYARAKAGGAAGLSPANQVARLHKEGYRGTT